MRPFQIHPLSALAGAVVGVLALLSMGLSPQLTNSGTVRVAVTKPVDVVPQLIPPQDMVQIASDNFAPDLTPVIPPNATLPVYSVPQDRWLVLTSAAFQIGGHVRLIEVSGGVETVAYWPQYLGPAKSTVLSVGIPYPPGSVVAFKNYSPDAGEPATFHLLGYLVDA